MFNAMISLLFAASISTWVFSKLSRSTGGRLRDAFVASTVVAVLVFVVVLVILNIIL